MSLFVVEQHMDTGVHIDVAVAPAYSILAFASSTDSAYLYGGDIDVQTFEDFWVVVTDPDADRVPTPRDNCPSTANTNQTNTDATNTSSNRPGTDALGDACDDDDDGDGYLDTTEAGLSENPLAYCAIMRADVGGDGNVSILDLSAVAMVYGQAVPPAPARRNQDGDSVISILDTVEAGGGVRPVSVGCS